MANAIRAVWTSGAYELGGPCVPVIVLRIETRDCAGFQKRKPNMSITASDCDLRVC